MCWWLYVLCTLHFHTNMLTKTAYSRLLLRNSKYPNCTVVYTLTKITNKSNVIYIFETTTTTTTNLIKCCSKYIQLWLILEISFNSPGILSEKKTKGSNINKYISQYFKEFLKGKGFSILLVKYYRPSVFPEHVITASTQLNAHHKNRWVYYVKEKRTLPYRLGCHYFLNDIKYVCKVRVKDVCRIFSYV